LIIQRIVIVLYAINKPECPAPRAKLNGVVTH
jgi:hypothetical protein